MLFLREDGVPRAIHVIYIVKMALYVWGIAALVPGGLRGLYDAASPEQYDDAFMRFVLYSGVFEVLGLGCGSGPLTAHCTCLARCSRRSRSICCLIDARADVREPKWAG